MDKLIGLLERYGVEVFEVSRRGDSFGIRCPYCGDSKNPRHYHAQVKYLPHGTRRHPEPFTGFHCVRCGEGGSLYRLLKYLGIVERPRVKGFAQKRKKPQSLGVEERFLIYEPVFKQEVFADNELVDEALHYLVDIRQYPEDFIKKALEEEIILLATNPGLKFTKDKKRLYGRVLFPSFNWAFVQGRRFLKDPQMKKYFIWRPLGSFIRDIIALKGSHNRNLVIVEGPLDALRIKLLGSSAISIQGVGHLGPLEYSYKVFPKTRDFIDSHDHVYLWMDGDVKVEKILEMREKLGKLFNKPIHLCDLEGKYKDPDSIHGDEEWREILKGSYAEEGRKGADSLSIPSNKLSEVDCHECGTAKNPSRG
jgi:hypothetical protein